MCNITFNVIISSNSYSEIWYTVFYFHQFCFFSSSRNPTRICACFSSLNIRSVDLRSHNRLWLCWVLFLKQKDPFIGCLFCLRHPVYLSVYPAYPSCIPFSTWTGLGGLQRYTTPPQSLHCLSKTDHQHQHPDLHHIYKAPCLFPSKHDLASDRTSVSVHHSGRGREGARRVSTLGPHTSF